MELIAVIFVLGLVLSITIPRIRFEPQTYRLKKLERELTTIFRMAQFLAISENREFYIYIDSNNKKILLLDSLPEIIENEPKVKIMYTIYLDKNIEIEKDLRESTIKVNKYGIIDNIIFFIEIEDKKYEFQIQKDGYEIVMKK